MDPSDLPTLHECLQATSWRRLLAIMASHGLPCSTRWRKEQLVEALQAHLLEPTTLRQVVLNLDGPARDALLALLRAGGALPAQTITATFGTIRPHRPWRKDAGPAQPWRDPASPTERLWYLGLLYLRPRRPKPGLTQYALVPADLLDELGHLLLTPQVGEPLRLLPRPGQTPDLVWYVALLLATLEEEAIRPLHGRWLPPRIVARLATRIGLDQKDDFQSSRSERRLPYLAFTHYLAEAAGLTTGGQRLGLTTLGWQWLAAPTAVRWQTLWQAWRDAPSDVTRPFNFLPAASLTSRARALVLAEISRLPLDGFVPLPQVVEAARLQDEYNWLAQSWGQDEDVVASLITGPLFWLGLVDVGEGPPVARDQAQSLDDAQDKPPISCQGRLVNLVPGSFGQSRAKRSLAYLQSLASSLLLRLTSLGAWLLELPDCGPPPFPSPEPCTVRPPEHDTVLIPPTAQPVHLARLAPIGTWSPPRPPVPEQRLQLSEERVGQAIARGTEVVQILHYLEEALGRPASRRQRQRLRGWARAGQQVRVRHLTVLETEDAALMGRLRSRKLIRRHLGDALSPTRSALDPAGLPSLLKTLRTLGLYTAAPPDRDGDSDREGSLSLSLSPLWMAGLVYKGLAAHVPLRVPLSAELMDAVAEQLPPAQREAAEHAAQQLLEQVEASLRGYLGLPPWQRRGNPEETVPTIEAALAEGQDLLLTYWGAGREQTLVRRVTPYYLERRGQTLYLIAHCHLRDDERVFRVDRIEACEGGG